MTSLSLRLRIFLFFCLIAVGGIGAIAVSAWLGFRQLGDPEALSAFTTVVIISAFALLALATFVWLLFDENVSKPIEALAAQFRVRANAGIDAEVDGDAARYLGDLAPAASVLHGKLAEISVATESMIARRTERLEQHRAQLLQILSDIPSATILVTRDHQIALYDGQAAELMEKVGPPRLFTSVFDYLDEGEIRALLQSMEAGGPTRRPVALTARCGRIYSGHLRWYGAGGYALMLEPLEPDAARPLVYDFDLLDKAGTAETLDTPLSDLVFVVFDTETTGLNPETDDVVQLGAVRVVNGRIIASETFDCLVNPGRPIPKTSTRVHKVTDEMVAKAPPFAEVCRSFHDFCRGAVLVAHNAPFDVTFLRREAGQGGSTFDHPVLDTVHLSAIVFGGSETHTLDALCDRLNITIASELRHTALGDALATAEALVAMLPVLEARGLSNFNAVQYEARKHSDILKVM